MTNNQRESAKRNPMIRHALIVFYILTILIISGFALAQPIEIINAQYDPSSHLLHIAGYLRNSCDRGAQLKAVDIRNTADETQAQLAVVPPKIHSARCSMMSTTFEMVVDVRTIPGLPKVTVNNKLRFELLGYTGGNPFFVATMKCSRPGFGRNLLHISGVLQAVRNNSFAENGTYTYMLQTPGDNTPGVLVTSMIDLSKYIGSYVEITGIQLYAPMNFDFSESATSAPIALQSINEL